MIMIILIIVIHAGRAESRAAVRISSLLPAPLILTQNEAAGFIPPAWRVAGVKPIQGDTFSGRLNIL